MSSITREQQAAIELNKDIAPFLKAAAGENPRSQSPSARRPAFSSAFAPSNEDRLGYRSSMLPTAWSVIRNDCRFRPVKTPPNPPPGAYNTQPTWKKGAVLMAPPAVVSKKVPDISPGWLFNLFLFCTELWVTTHPPTIYYCMVYPNPDPVSITCPVQLERDRWTSTGTARMSWSALRRGWRSMITRCQDRETMIRPLWKETSWESRIIYCYQIIIISFWMNPFVYIYERSVPFIFCLNMFLI